MIKINLPLKHEPSRFQEFITNICSNQKMEEKNRDDFKTFWCYEKINMRNDVVQNNGNGLCSHLDQREDG